MKTKFSGILTLLLAFVVQLSFAQEKTISGIVSDQDGLPLPGVNIIVKGTTTGTQSDFDGNYSIKASSGNILIYSYVGLKTQEVDVGSSNTINVQLEEDAAGLDEVVVVAYGSEKSSNVSSAIETVKSEDIESIPIASLDQVLQGRASGVNIQTSSGQPGESGTIILRGRNSINGNIEPLFVIDGVPVDEDNFRSINPNDIESVSVLKDASASALYGNRAAGGVFIVTTKSGKRGEGVNFQYRAQYGFSNYNDPGFEVMTSSQFLKFQQENGTGLGGTLNDNEIRFLANQANTDWREIFFRQGLTNNHEVSVTTGGEKSTSFNSLSYFEQEGITQRSDIQRFTLRSNTSTNLNNRLKVTTNLTLGYTKNRFAQNEGTGQLDNPFLSPYLSLPFVSPYNPDGSLNILGTPYTTANGTNINGFLNTPFITLNTNALNSDNEDELRIIGRVAGELEVIDNVKVISSVGMDYVNTEFFEIVTPNSIRGDITPDANSINKGSQTEGYLRNIGINVNSIISYNNTFNDLHYVDLKIGTEYFKQHFKRTQFRGFGLNPKLLGSGNGFTDPSVTEGADETQFYIPSLANNDIFSNSYDRGLFSYFFAGTYDYDNRYGLSASVRRDASDRFSATNKWGTFWSVSGKWNIHNEEFFNNDGVINELKLRASYGTVGNSRVADFEDFPAETLYEQGFGYNGTIGYTTLNIGNPDLKWETTSQLNVGLDFSLLKYKLTGTIDVYKKKTTDLYISQPLSLLSGERTIDANVGALENKGFELSLNYQIFDGDFKWSVNGNVAYNQNEITDLGSSYDPENPILATGGTVLAEGYPIGTFYRVRWAGVNPADGSPLWLDADGNVTNTFTTDNRVFLDKTRDPLYIGGFGTDLSYKGFNLNAFFTYAAEQYRLNGSYAIIEDTNLAGFANMSTSMLRIWKQPGDVTDIPGFGQVTRAQAGTRYLEDASFLRLRNISLSYNLSDKVLEKTKFFTGCRVFIQGQNLLTFTKWRGFDPESDIASTFFEFPTPKTVTVGLDVKF